MATFLEFLGVVATILIIGIGVILFIGPAFVDGDILQGIVFFVITTVVATACMIVIGGLLASLFRKD